MSRRPLAARLRRLFVRAELSRRRVRTPRLRALTLVALLVAGFMIASAALAARGQDLRPNRNTDLIQLVRDQAARNRELADEVRQLRADVDRQAQQEGAVPVDTSAAAEAAALSAVRGPAVSVTLTDAPLSVKPAGVAEELLIVHQQDIQSVVNALWSGGAEAMTIQGQRVTSRTGVKCVGNTVVLHGIPYAPPYVIAAIGDQLRLEAALESSSYLTVYRRYADKYGLGYSEKRVADLRMEPYAGAVDLRYAKPSR